MMSRLLKMIGLVCRVQSVLQGSFAKETYHFKEPTNRSQPNELDELSTHHIINSIITNSINHQHIANSISHLRDSMSYQHINSTITNSMSYQHITNSMSHQHITNSISHLRDSLSYQHINESSTYDQLNGDAIIVLLANDPLLLHTLTTPSLTTHLCA